MSVLKKLQFAAAPAAGFADLPIIGAGTTECQKAVRAIGAARGKKCSTDAR
jgi:hypothetical protein